MHCIWAAVHCDFFVNHVYPYIWKPVWLKKDFAHVCRDSEYTYPIYYPWLYNVFHFALHMTCPDWVSLKMFHYLRIYLSNGVWLIVKLRRKSCSLSLCSRFLTTWFYVRTHGKVFACHLVRSSLEKYMYVRARIPKLFSKRKYLTSKNDELWSKDVRRNESNLSTNDFFSEKEKINIIGRLLLYCARKDDDLWIYTFKLATVR